MAVSASLVTPEFVSRASITAHWEICAFPDDFRPGRVLRAAVGEARERRASGDDDAHRGGSARRRAGKDLRRNHAGGGLSATDRLPPGEMSVSHITTSGELRLPSSRQAFNTMLELAHWILIRDYLAMAERFCAADGIQSEAPQRSAMILLIIPRTSAEVVDHHDVRSENPTVIDEPLTIG